MADDNTQATGANTPAGEGTTQAGAAGQPGSGTRTFTQEELDAKVRSRLERERAKYADYDDLKAAAEAHADYDAVVAERDALKASAERAELVGRVAACLESNRKCVRLRRRVAPPACTVPDRVRHRRNSSSPAHTVPDRVRFRRIRCANNGIFSLHAHTVPDRVRHRRNSSSHAYTVPDHVRPRMVLLSVWHTNGTAPRVSPEPYTVSVIHQCSNGRLGRPRKEVTWQTTNRTRSRRSLTPRFRTIPS